jgi:hypothetical protein
VAVDAQIYHDALVQEICAGSEVDFLPQITEG